MDMPITFQGKQENKDIRIERIKAHMLADRLKSGTYAKGEGKTFHACAIGCHLWDIAIERGIPLSEVNNKNRHKIVAEDYGWPEWLAHVEDEIFEGLTGKDRQQWPLRLVEAIPVGVDLTTIKHRFLAWIVRDFTSQFYDIKKFPKIREISLIVADLHERSWRGEDISKTEWDSIVANTKNINNAITFQWTQKHGLAAWVSYVVAKNGRFPSMSNIMISNIHPTSFGSTSSLRDDIYKQISDKILQFIYETKRE